MWWHQIIDLRADGGKWAELWFANGKRNPNECDVAVKGYMLQEAIENAGLSGHVWRHGRVGLWVCFDSKWNPVHVARELADAKGWKLEDKLCANKDSG